LLLDDGDMHPLIENNREAIAELCRIQFLQFPEFEGSAGGTFPAFRRPD